MTTPTLAELNRHLFAAMLPETHALGPKAKGRVAAVTAKDRAAVQELREAGLAKPEYTPEQLAALAAAGITDPTTKSAEEIAAILAAVS